MLPVVALLLPVAGLLAIGRLLAGLLSAGRCAAWLRPVVLLLAGLLRAWRCAGGLLSVGLLLGGGLGTAGLLSVCLLLAIAGLLPVCPLAVCLLLAAGLLLGGRGRPGLGCLPGFRWTLSAVRRRLVPGIGLLLAGSALFAAVWGLWSAHGANLAQIGRIVSRKRPVCPGE